jgi:hypothetical protein
MSLAVEDSEIEGEENQHKRDKTEVRPHFHACGIGGNCGGGE